MSKYVGQSLKRVEDPRFIQGKGKYVANLSLPGMGYMAIKRSPYAHATINSIDASEALAAGIRRIVTMVCIVGCGLPPRDHRTIGAGIRESLLRRRRRRRRAGNVQLDHQLLRHFRHIAVDCRCARRRARTATRPAVHLRIALEQLVLPRLEAAPRR